MKFLGTFGGGGGGGRTGRVTNRAGTPAQMTRGRGRAAAGANTRGAIGRNMRSANKRGFKGAHR